MPSKLLTITLSFLLIASGLIASTASLHATSAPWSEDFENTKANGWVLGANWSVKKDAANTFYSYVLHSSQKVLTSVITPKLTIKQGEALTFMAVKNKYTKIPTCLST